MKIYKNCPSEGQKKGKIEMKFTTTNGDISLKVKNHIIDELKAKHPDKEIDTVTVTIDGDYLDVDFTYKTLQFERIRRITDISSMTMRRKPSG